MRPNVVRVKTAESSWNRQHFAIASMNVVLGAGVTLRMNEMASLTTTLKVGEAADEIR